MTNEEALAVIQKHVTAMQLWVSTGAPLEQAMMIARWHAAIKDPALAKDRAEYKEAVKTLADYNLGLVIADAVRGLTPVERGHKNTVESDVELIQEIIRDIEA